MKIDSYRKLITVESMTDEVCAMNYLFIYLTADERRGWRIRNTTKKNVEARQAIRNLTNQGGEQGRD